MKIHIFFPFTSAPYGGGNQFLKALRSELERRHLYTPRPDEANIIIVNGYHQLLGYALLRLRYPHKIYIHRLGPLFALHRAPHWHIIDTLVLRWAHIAHGIAWQSRWSKEQAGKNIAGHPLQTIIPNAPDPLFFNRDHAAGKLHHPIRLVFVSFSTNPKKGLDLLAYLHKHLNFATYQITFIGPLPAQRLARVYYRGLLSSEEVANELKQQDIFISPAQDEAWSNALSEALACGVPVVARHSGANPETVGRGGELFTTPPSLLHAIDTVTKNYDRYRSRITTPDIVTIANQYLALAQKATTQKLIVKRPWKLAAQTLALAVRYPLR